MKFVLGQKVNMTQVFDENGALHPGTIISCGANVVTQVKTDEKDGYKAVQIGYGTRNPKNVNKAQKGHTKELGNFSNFREFTGVSDLKVGDTLSPALFKVGEKVVITSVSKGKGFQGVIKRHGFGGGRRTHGQKHSEREPGSIGGGLRTRVPKGMRMGGRMGQDTITSKGMTVLMVDEAKREIIIGGAVPGRRGTLVEIKG
ncbi:MAG: 50S ribosomal protein L3 [Candidatus Pacebacteria bacterium]|nr:50S ribosomal protein L3 [Candidatus Paceibacterota bacterium]